MRSIDCSVGRKVGAACVALVLSACSNPPYPRGSVEALFPEGPRPQLRMHHIQNRVLQTAEIVGAGSTPVFFIHGSPGDWKAWAHYLAAPELKAYGTLVAVDRPGFGGSDGGNVIPDLRAQAQLLAQLIPNDQRAVVVGHSLGGPLAAWMAIDHPEKVCGVVMVAGSVGTPYEAPRWYNRIAESWPGRQLVPREMGWSNIEMMSLQGQLRQLDGAWPLLVRPVVMVQGDKDDLVDPRTPDHALSLAPARWLRIVRVPEQGHFVLWKKPDVVIDAIRRLPCGPAAVDAF